MLTTVFKRWDGQYVVYPNQALSKRELRNMRRSAQAANCIFVHVTRRATVDDITALREGLRAAARAAPRTDHAVLPDSIAVNFRSVVDGECSKHSVLCRLQRSCLCW
jgi:small-conductance mechanosensitive channel